MKKIINKFLLLIIILIITLILLLSTIGIETNKFNKFITDKVSQTKNITLELSTVKFKINLKQLNLFIETINPKITFKNILVPVQNVKTYIDFYSLIKSDLKIKKINLILEELDIVQLNQLSKIIKPSNFKSLINNKIKEGILVSEIEIFLTEQGVFKDFIAKGSVKDSKVELFNGLNFSRANFSFADKSDVLIKNIFGDLEDVKISDGDIKLNFEDGIKLTSNFNSKINLDELLLNKYSNF